MQIHCKKPMIFSNDKKYSHQELIALCAKEVLKLQDSNDWEDIMLGFKAANIDLGYVAKKEGWFDKFHQHPIIILYAAKISSMTNEKLDYWNSLDAVKKMM